MKTLLIFCLLLLPAGVMAQNLTLEQLINVYNKEEDEIDVYLGNKGWERCPTGKPPRIATWAYDRRMGPFIPGTTTGPTYEAAAWLSMVIGDEDSFGITYSIHSLKKFNDFRARVMAIGMKKVDYTSTDQKTLAVYEGANYRVELATLIGEGGLFENNSYSVYLTGKK